MKKRLRQLRLFTKPDHHALKPIRGEHYREACGECSIPPWKVCACSSRMRKHRIEEAA